MRLRRLPLWAAVSAFFAVSSAHAQLSQSIASIAVSNTAVVAIAGTSVPSTYVAAICVSMSPVYPQFYGSLSLVNLTGQTAASFFRVVPIGGATYEVWTIGGILPAGTYTGTLVASEDIVTNTNHIFEQSVTFTVVAP